MDNGKIIWDKLIAEGLTKAGAAGMSVATPLIPAGGAPRLAKSANRKWLKRSDTMKGIDVSKHNGAINIVRVLKFRCYYIEVEKW